MPPWVRISPSSTLSPPGPTCFHPVRSFPLNSCCHSPDWAFRVIDDNATSSNTQSQCLSIIPPLNSRRKIAETEADAVRATTSSNQITRRAHGIVSPRGCFAQPSRHRDSVLTSERQMHCQLQEAVAPDCLSDHAIVVRIRRARGQDRGWVRKTRVRIEAAIQREIAVRSIEIGMVENVEGVGLEFQGEAFPELEIRKSKN